MKLNKIKKKYIKKKFLPRVWQAFWIQMIKMNDRKKTTTKKHLRISFNSPLNSSNFERNSSLHNSALEFMNTSLPHYTTNYTNKRNLFAFVRPICLRIWKLSYLISSKLLSFWFPLSFRIVHSTFYWSERREGRSGCDFIGNIQFTIW